jgi:phosphotransacetylase
MSRETGTGKYEQVLERCRRLEPVPTAVAHPCEESALAGALEAGARGLITPILVGPAARIHEVARQRGIDLGHTRIVDAPHSHAAAAMAVDLVRRGEAELVMKGSLHTDELLGAVVARETGLRTGRRISHVFIMDVPTYHKVLIVTDGAIAIAPTLEDKVDICQNAIDLAVSLGLTRPKVAILAAVETVTSKMPATIDAAACARCRAGQIVGGALEGPLAFDNAISSDAAKTKGVRSEVAGDPDILIAPGPRGRQHPGEAAQLPRQRGQRRRGARRAGADHPDEPCRQRSSRIASCAVACSRHTRGDRRCTRRRRAGCVRRRSLAMDGYALVLNAGSRASSSASIGSRRAGPWCLEMRGQIEGIGTSPRFSARNAQDRSSGMTR